MGKGGERKMKDKIASVPQTEKNTQVQSELNELIHVAEEMDTTILRLRERMKSVLITTPKAETVDANKPCQLVSHAEELRNLRIMLSYQNETLKDTIACCEL